MPKDLEIDKLVSNLTKKTQEGKLGWGPTADEHAFICVLQGEFTFSIKKFDYQGDDRCYFSMTDSTGAEIAELAASSFEFHYSELAELHEAARRSSLGVESKLSKVADILNRL